MNETQRRYTIKDIAEQSGVSLSTVSLVLNDNPRISESTRARVLKTIQRLGYQPNRAARALAWRHTRTLAVLVPQLRHAFADVYFGEIVSGIHDRASRLGYKIMLEVARTEFIESKEYYQLYDQKFVDGILFIGANSHHRFVSDLSDGARPFVMVNNYSREHDLNYVVANHRYGAWQAAKHLVRLGHKRIGFIAGGLGDIQTSRDMLEAFQDVLEDHGIEGDPNLVVDGWLTEEGGMKATEDLLRRNPDVTAVFSSNDKMALGAIKKLNELGMRVPQDVAVVGFDDIPQASFSIPGLTTVRQPLYEIGRMACERMVDLIHGKINRVREVLPVHLTVRESCGARRKGIVSIPNR
ncbi:MAG TPA: LacI family DNA-binding transcriptional regulator [Verrucomicrobiae bacterium]|nr:LacI family DNA-binding transcriptional regulator [Verrucomicrobiae bacterium]